MQSIDHCAESGYIRLQNNISFGTMGKFYDWSPLSASFPLHLTTLTLKVHLLVPVCAPKDKEKTEILSQNSGISILIQCC